MVHTKNRAGVRCSAIFSRNQETKTMVDARRYIIVLAITLLSACSNDSGNNQPYNGDNEAATATVFEEKNSIQCGSSGLSTEQSRQTLITNGIDVIQSDCAYNNLMAVPSVCGADTSEILVHEIPNQNIVDAEKFGFTNTDDINNDYSIYDCI